MRKISLVLSIFTIMYACSDSPSNAPVNLKVEYGSRIVDEATPRFSWTLDDTVRGAKQNAYQILIASSTSVLNEKKADLWNSGKVESDQSIFVNYGGSNLESGKRYFWTVKIWNHDNQESEWSAAQSFDMAFLNASLWKAKWIGANESTATVDSLRPKSIMLRNEIKIQKKIKLAKAYVTGLGSYQFFLNGKKVSDNLLTPGWTDYPTRIIYQVYDLTDQLLKGTNTTGLMLGNVWYSSGLGWQGGSSYSNGPLMGLLQLEIEYTDGSREAIISDDSWKWHFSPITENTLYHGEHYDARLELDGWMENGFDDSNWDQADVFDAQKGILSAHTSPMIKITREIAPVSVKKLENNSFVFDMGLNMTGGIRLNVEGDEGSEIVMKFAELLHEDGSVAQENLRSAIATDKYILRGDGPESWEPAFTYHGFRYVEISGLPNEPDSKTVIGLNYHNAAKETGSFSCSNKLINTIQTNIQNGQRSNMFSVPTDCPQRDERLGWMGDAQVFAATSCYNMDMSGFYAKWVRDISDSQNEEGWVTDVNPAIVVTGPAKPAWGDAFIIVPWEMYRFYNDTRILEKFYDDYKAWVEYMRTNAEPDGLYIYDADGWGGYADWIAVVESPQQPISAAYYYFSTKLLAKFADILNYTDDKVEYTALASEIETAFQKRYFSEIPSNYEGGTQTAMLLPMNFGLTPEDQMEKVAANLLADVEAKGKHPSTGFLGTKYLLPTLSNCGYHDVAYETVISEEYPSWGYMAVNGATSMWELWNSDTEKPEGMNSRNHFALGSIGEWFYSHLAGIRIDDANPGFKHSIIAPMPADGLDWAKAEIMSPYGVIKSSWENKDGIFTLNVTVAPNTTATIKMPVLDGSRMELFEGGSVLIKEFKNEGKVDGIAVENITDSFVEMNVASGTYKFELLY
ncbi:MAG: glycoside hydrolase family 78 protein [Bacteroidales bacterium]|jgi:alpha-L-rhamnosidase|nr:glycoside hydrolase family 78 protein [Bacteroidales bacterium]